MAKYVEYKTKKFQLKKDATEWAKKQKASFKGVKVMKIETNYNANDPMPWEAVVLMKE